MRYVSCYRDSRTLRAAFTAVQVMVLVAPVSIIAFVVITLHNLRLDWRALPSRVWWLLAIMLILSLTVYILVRQFFRRHLTLTVDVTAEGIHHLAPPPVRTILWRDMVLVRRIPYGKGIVALQLRTRTQRYTLSPQLVPDSPDAPRLRVGPRGQFWEYPSGEVEPCDLKHSYAYRLIREHRPDLLSR
ncbi:hypothetical protein KKH27_09920 [bacterium]|nr:hypothetical protein [bacterium]MBU1984485.1 hypothetical protein [bacterium]